MQPTSNRCPFLPSGPRCRMSTNCSPATKWSRLMRDLAEHDPNRIVIVDAPPLHAGTEAGVLARMVGQVVMLVEADKTPQAIGSRRVHQLKGCETVSHGSEQGTTAFVRSVAYGYGYGYGTKGVRRGCTRIFSACLESRSSFRLMRRFFFPEQRAQARAVVSAVRARAG